MYRGCLSTWQEVDTPPTHLQKDKRTDDHPKSQTLTMTRQQTIMDVDEVGEPGDGGPGFLGIPRPIVAPSLFRPESAKHHAEGHENQSDVDEGRCMMDDGRGKKSLDKSIDGYDGSDTHQRVAHDIDQDVGKEPRAL